MREEARQGTATSGCPLRVVRMRLVAKGVRVMTVLRPAGRHTRMYEFGAYHASKGCSAQHNEALQGPQTLDRRPAKPCIYVL